MRKKQHDRSLNVIDLKAVFLFIIKYWYIYVLIVIGSLLFVYIFHSIKPDIYHAQVKIRIGKFGNTELETYNSIYSHIALEFPQKDITLLNTLDGKSFQGYKVKYSDMVLVLSIKDTSSDKALADIHSVSDYIISRHNEIYKNAKEKLDMQKIKKDRLVLYILDSYNYPTKMIGKPSVSTKPLQKIKPIIIIKTFFTASFWALVLIYIIYRFKLFRQI